MPMAPLARRATSESRGRHLVAADKIEKGQLIFCERPMVDLQSTGNVHAGVLVCHYCTSFCGKPEQALQVAVDPSTLPEITTHQCDDQREGTHALIPCRNKCGHVYCSLECQQDDWEWGGHKELCTGCIADPEHPLIQFIQHAIQSNEIFLLIAKWLTRIHNHRLPYQEDDSNHDHPYTDFSMEPWWDVATLPLKNDPMGFAEMIALETSCKRLCEESCELLRAAWPEQVSSLWLTPIGIARLIGSLEQNCMGIRRKHALRRSLMEDSQLRQKYHSQLIRCLEKAGMIGDCEDNDNDDNNKDEPKNTEDGNIGVAANDAAAKQDAADQNKRPENILAPDEDWDYSPDEIACFLSNLPYPLNIGSDDEWDEIISPMDGTAHLSFAEKMNHSCDPNVVLLYRTHGWGRDHPLVAYCVALRDVKPGEELTLSYIELDEPYNVRQQMLANYGFVCTCQKCEREKNGEDIAHTEEEEEAQADEDDLFGADDDDDDEHDNDLGEVENDEQQEGDDGLSGDDKLRNTVERLDSFLNKAIHATIPLKYLAPAANYNVQLATSLIKDKESWESPSDNNTVSQLLEQCADGIKSRDFGLCRIVGSDLESHLYKKLRSSGAFSSPAYREAYWCACSTAAIGYAHEGSFLLAMQKLDKAIILGQKRQPIDGFFSYVETHASQMAATPCPHAIDCKVADYNASEVQEMLLTTGLSKPIAFPIEEQRCSPLQFGALVKTHQQPAVIRGLAKQWPATTKWRSIDRLSRAYGHRLIPIEVGSMMTGMTERLSNFRSFICTYLAPSTTRQCWSLQDVTNGASQIAYLAQHPLLEQIPQLYEDVEVNPCGIDPTNVNAWIGTGGTRTPLHFDSYDNLLIQMVGAKYVRLYDSKEVSRVYVSNDSSYGLQGNISELDCEQEDFDKHPLAKDCPYTEVLLLPGDCLFIPARHWHYARSLSTSISVNYWF